MVPVPPRPTQGLRYRIETLIGKRPSMLNAHPHYPTCFRSVRDYWSQDGKVSYRALEIFRPVRHPRHKTHIARHRVDVRRMVYLVHRHQHIHVRSFSLYFFAMISRSYSSRLASSLDR
jgi:hypothetical protein